MPRVSIIIPTYNRAKFIKEALDSVFLQTYRNYEIIVIDDGSSDRTETIIRSLRNDVRYLYQDNQGRAAARQRGVNEAKGEYVAFLDSDDKWLPEKLEKQMYYIKKKHFVGLLHTSANVIDENGLWLKSESRKLDREYDYALRKGFSYANLLYRCPLLFSTVVMPKKLIERLGGFNERYKVLEDYDFILRLIKNEKIELLNEKLAYYRYHSNNACRAYRKLVESAYLSIYEEHLNNLCEIKDLKERKKAEQYIYENLINISYCIKDKTSAFGYIKRFLKKYPAAFFNIKGIKNILKLITL